MKKTPEIRFIFYNGDVFVKDFRNVKEYLDAMRLVGFHSQLITKVRFVMDVINEYLKTCFQ